MKPFNFDTPLDTLELQFRKMRPTPRAIDMRYEFLTAENGHDAAALLLAVHYGSDEEVKEIKTLIEKSHKAKFFPNSAGTKRIKMASALLIKHRVNYKRK